MCEALPSLNADKASYITKLTEKFSPKFSSKSSSSYSSMDLRLVPTEGWSSVKSDKFVDLCVCVCVCVCVRACVINVVTQCRSFTDHVIHDINTLKRLHDTINTCT